MKPRTVISMEQALSLPYATGRFVQLGWRVIRVEAPARNGDPQPGDPNRYIGSLVADEGRRSYYIAPNVGKEAIALNLKHPEGQAALRCLIQELDAEIFCCNTIPGRYESLGIDYERLSAERPGLIWAGISAMGPAYPDMPGYDPMIQAMAGYMELTGAADGPPTLSGLPVVDLKAGDELYANVMLALAEKADTGRGKRIDISMLQAASSWLITTLPLVDLDCAPEELTRWGNAHRKYIPTNVYAAADGFIYVAVGSNAQWDRLTATAEFASLGKEGGRSTAVQRYDDRAAIYAELGRIASKLTSAELTQIFIKAKIPHARINTIPEVIELDAVGGKATRTTLPDGRRMRLPPMPVDLDGASATFTFAPAHGEHTSAVLREAGYAESDLQRLRAESVIG